MSKEKGVAIFRCFDDLNILSLLALQAEIIDLEKAFRRECRLDEMPGDGQQPSGPSQYSENFKLSRESNSEQYSKLKAIRERLREYNELVLQVFQLNQLDDPIPSQLDTLKDWLRDVRGNPFLTGYEAETWADSKKGLYMCLRRPTADNDPFMRYTSNVLVGIYHRLLGQDLKTGQIVDEATGHTSYSNSHINKAGNVITTALASVFPVLTIYVLNQLSSTNLRIGVTAAFTAVFAFMIAIFSSASRVEMFAATATFAAVEVVFIGSAIGGSNNQITSSNSTLAG